MRFFGAARAAASAAATQHTDFECSFRRQLLCAVAGWRNLACMHAPAGCILNCYVISRCVPTGGVVVCRGSTCSVVFEDVCFTHCTLVATDGATVTIMHGKFNNLPAYAPKYSHEAGTTPPSQGHGLSLDQSSPQNSSARVAARAPPPRDRVAIYAHGRGTKVTAGDVTIRGGMQV